MLNEPLSIAFVSLISNITGNIPASINVKLYPDGNVRNLANNAYKLESAA